jgi:hypothetical protein
MEQTQLRDLDLIARAIEGFILAMILLLAADGLTADWHSWRAARSRRSKRSAARKFRR